jgi:hypothetical protein
MRSACVIAANCHFQEPKLVNFINEDRMKTDSNEIKNSAMINVDEVAAETPPSPPSPELAGFLELIGSSLAQAWSDQSTNKPSQNRADTIP